MKCIYSKVRLYCLNVLKGTHNYIFIRDGTESYYPSNVSLSIRGARWPSG